jgi:hypothetical protein
MCIRTFTTILLLLRHVGGASAVRESRFPLKTNEKNSSPMHGSYLQAVQCLILNALIDQPD